LEKANLVENRIDCPQGTGVTAERLMDENRPQNKGREYEKLDIE